MMDVTPGVCVNLSYVIHRMFHEMYQLALGRFVSIELLPYRTIGSRMIKILNILQCFKLTFLYLKTIYLSLFVITVCLTGFYNNHHAAAN